MTRISTQQLPCPCCGYLVLEEGPGAYEICPICFWEDDLSQLRFVTMPGGANRPSLVEAQLNYATLGASQARFSEDVRRPRADERRDEGWRPVDLAIDPEIPEPGVDQGNTYPRDRATLYYWRPTFWRRAAT